VPYVSFVIEVYSTDLKISMLFRSGIEFHTKWSIFKSKNRISGLGFYQRHVI